ncbi:uncharacterized protein METZ01_LOCUS361021 [marine metagenome]|uniref:SnoaL-like domain-containing protein n=1 Tax=marine metagenome TaxID=408172 RepID=A0A382SG37_9ZZZZ
MSDTDLQRYAEFFERLSSGRLNQLASVMTEDIRFVDPFNDVNGLKQVEKIFRNMFGSLNNPTFTVTHSAMAGNLEPRGLIRWELHSVVKGLPYIIVGMSEVCFADDGRVKSHVDHWDAAKQFYEHLPIVGWLLRMIRVRMMG